MSQIVIKGSTTRLPPVYVNSTTASPTTQLNATGETCHLIGTILLENPLGGSKTISAAGGGSIVWRAGLSTLANAGTTFKVGIQDVSTASSPAQGDGTFDVEASFTGGGGGVSSNAVNTSTMTSGTKTIAHGDLVAITFSMTARAGADSILITNNLQVDTVAILLPTVTENTTGTYTRSTTSAPNAYIIFDDGTIGWFPGMKFTAGSVTTETFNSGTGTADEYGNFINYPHTFMALGIGAYVSFAGNSSDAELLLYSTPLGTPVVERTITVDATQLSNTATTQHYIHLFSSPFFLKANTDYGVTIRPTTTNNLSIYYQDTNNSTGGKTGTANSNCYAVRRLDNSGAFSDYNGGTSKTRRMSIYLIGSHMEQGVNMCSGQVGVY